MTASQKAKRKKVTTSSWPWPGVGPHTERFLARLNITTPFDLLLHFPTRYQDRTQIVTLRHAPLNQEVVIEGVIEAIVPVSRGRTKFCCEVRDHTGSVHLRFFHILPFQLQQLKVGVRLRCYGELTLGQLGKEMLHPEYKVIATALPPALETELTPTYAATEGLSQYMLRKLTQQALTWLDKTKALPELLPKELLPVAPLSLAESLRAIHRPSRDTQLEELAAQKTPAQQRIIFEELLAHRLSLLRMKSAFQGEASIPLHKNHLGAQLLSQLPFQLTRAQQRVCDEIANDLTRPFPMLRLVQGDVGSGKTIVAAWAMLQAVSENRQAVLMAPTELLAEQHYRSFLRWLTPLNITVVLLTGQVKGKARQTLLNQIATQEATIVIGTHAVFQEQVEFANLALVVVDEQHRFGVEQRAQLRHKGKQDNAFPHQLIMTATPIPRTLAMSFYADLDVSVIDELPPGRTPIVTSVIHSERREEVIERIRKACEEGRQVYWVCPLIEESEAIACQAATITAELLTAQLQPWKIGLVHGRLKSAEKEIAMQAFQQGETQVLVATTVIEVGVDVPNASVMVIENAERLGLSQLHQLRGRVGRGAVASFCLLLYQYPLSQMGRERLQVMRETTDGFKIAERDLELRGPGEVMGTRQTGDVGFRVADLARDALLSAKVQEAAQWILTHCPEIIEPLIARWLGKGYQYGKV